MPLEGNAGSVLTADGIAMIDGLQQVLGAGVTSFDGGNIILGGDGNDTITGRGGDDIIDGDKWLNVRISVRANADGTGEIASHNSMTTLVAQVFSGAINPGQLQVVREIMTAATATWTPRGIRGELSTDTTIERFRWPGFVRVIDADPTGDFRTTATDTLYTEEKTAAFAGGVGAVVQQPGGDRRTVISEHQRHRPATRPRSQRPAGRLRA